MRRNRQMCVIVSNDYVEKVNEIMLRNGYGNNYIHVPITTSKGRRVVRHAVETVVDRAEQKAMEMALKKVSKTHKVLEIERVGRKKKRIRKLDALLAKKGLQRKRITLRNPFDSKGKRR